jgi:hypothetical protein
LPEDALHLARDLSPAVGHHTCGSVP